MTRIAPLRPSRKRFERGEVGPYFKIHDWPNSRLLRLSGDSDENNNSVAAVENETVMVELVVD